MTPKQAHAERMLRHLESTMIFPLTRHEKDQLYSIGGPIYGKGARYFWGKKTMPKLAAKGLVEPHPVDPTNAWRITQAGKEQWELRNSTPGGWL
jgi:hypothetical protein